MKIKRLIGLVALTLTFSVSASYANEKSKFSVGLTYVGAASVYKNVNNVSAVMPSISYESGNLSISYQEGLAYQFFDGEKVKMSASVAPRNRPYNSGRSSDLTGMTRELYYDGALKVSYQISRGLNAKFKFATEVTDKFNGNLADISLNQFIPILGQPVIFQGGAKWYDSNRANYLYGVKASEATVQRVQYASGSVTTPYVSISTFYSLTKKTSLFANVNSSFLPSNVVDSPIVEDKNYLYTVLGINYNF
ncbi:MipA/OmpV family protein [Planktomarina sp.]|nr:MipA/OmpV family protein [Planktomarina sp.]MDA9253258.1 MipA/OmpV family protein [Planktomarina sp.]